MKKYSAFLKAPVLLSLIIRLFCIISTALVAEMQSVYSTAQPTGQLIQSTKYKSLFCVKAYVCMY